MGLYGRGQRNADQTLMMAIDTGAVDRALGAIGTTFRLTRLYPPSHPAVLEAMRQIRDRKSTRLNSSHLVISYAVFCLKKKKNKTDHLQLLHLQTIQPNLHV